MSLISIDDHSLTTESKGISHPDTKIYKGYRKHPPRKAKSNLPRIPPPSPPSPRTPEEDRGHSRQSAIPESAARYLQSSRKKQPNPTAKRRRVRTPPPPLPPTSVHFMPSDYDFGSSTPESARAPTFCLGCGCWPEDCRCDGATPPSGSARRDRRDGPASTEQVKYAPLSDDGRKGTFADNLAAFDGYVPPDAKVQGMDIEDVDEWRNGVGPYGADLCPPSTPTRVHTRDGHRQAQSRFSAPAPALGFKSALPDGTWSAQHYGPPLPSSMDHPATSFPTVKPAPNYDGTWVDYTASGAPYTGRRLRRYISDDSLYAPLEESSFKPQPEHNVNDVQYTMPYGR